MKKSVISVAKIIIDTVTNNHNKISSFFDDPISYGYKKRY
jgi:hypothetical protein